MSDSGPGRREVAYRLFAAEFDDAEFSYSESDEERAPNFVVTPTGARVNRLFAVGVLTEVEDVNPEMVRGRVVDPTGAFVTYAGQYQPDELAFLERVDPPTFLAMSGKARTFEPDDGDRTYTSVRPESVSEVDAETRDRWVVSAAERTLERVGVMASAIESGLTGDRLRAALAEAGVDERLADGVALALDHYGTTPAYLAALRETALGALRVVAGERDEVERLDIAPGEERAAPEGPRGEGGDGEAGSASGRSSGQRSREEAAGADAAARLATLELSEPEVPEPASASAETATGDEEAIGDEEATGDAETADEGPDADSTVAETGTPTTSEPEVGTETDPETGTAAAAGAEPDATSTDAGTDPETGAVSGTEPEPVDADEPAEVPDTAAEAEPTTGAESASDDGRASDPVAEPDDVEAEPDDVDPGEFDLDEEERREVEAEYGTEFSTADEMDEPDAEATDVGGDSETPAEAEPAEGAPSEAAEAGAESGEESEPDPEPGSEAESGSAPDLDESVDEPAESADETTESADETTESADEPAESVDESAESADETTEDVDLEDAVMETMETLDEGDGADSEELVSTVADEYDADPDAVEDAIQDALMSGRCYEPSDGVLKSI